MENITNIIENTNIGEQSQEIVNGEIRSDGTVEVNYVFSEIPTTEYKYAEVSGGQIIAIHKHHLPLKLFKQLFSNERKSDFFDIYPAEQDAGFEAAIGDYVNFNENGTISITRPVFSSSIDSEVERKIDELKLIRNTMETENIEIDGFTFDYDEKSRERLAIAREVILISGQPIKWTLADNTTTMLTVELSQKIVIAAATRSNELHIKYRQLADSIKEIAEDSSYTDEEKINMIRHTEWR